MIKLKVKVDMKIRGFQVLDLMYQTTIVLGKCYISEII